MTSNFKENLDTYNEILFTKILNGGSLSKEVELLRKTAKEYLLRVRMVEEADTMLALDRAVQIMPDDQEGLQQMGLLLRDLYNRYDVVHDDLFIVAAFENFAKAELLSKRYLVHRISNPKELARKQHRKPIHINSIRSKKYRDDVFIEHFTLGVDTLLNHNYSLAIGITESEKYALEKCRQIRNSIHFGGPKWGYGLGKGLINGLSEFRKRFEN